jgi:hypothetical protein
MKTKARIRFSLIFIFLVVALITAGHFWRNRQRVDGRRAVSLSSADRVEVFRIDANDLKRPSTEYIGDYPVVATSAIMSHKSREQLIRFLQPYLQDQAYRPDETKCDPRPGLAFRIWQQKSFLEFTVCLSCNLLRIVDQRGGWHSFSEDRPFLVGLAKEAFRQDKIVQQLSEKESDKGDFYLENSRHQNS